MAQIDANEGNGEENELMEWLKSKEKFLDYQVSMDDLRTLDLKKDLELININK